MRIPAQLKDDFTYVPLPKVAAGQLGGAWLRGALLQYAEEAKVVDTRLFRKISLRQKGASYRLIRELLATADVAVAVDTIGNFVREVIEQRPPARPGTRRRPVRALSEPSAARRLTTSDEPKFPFTVAPPVEVRATEQPAAVPPVAPNTQPPAERPRTRGPRIADPANL